MILRGATLSRETCALDVPQPAVAARAIPDVSRFYGSALQGYAGEDSPPAFSQSPALSLDAVSAWLATCTAVERASLANALTTDIEQQRSAAQAEGFAAGQAQALEEAQTRTQSLLSALGALVQGAQTAFEKEAAQLAAQCAEIVSEAFLKMAGAQLATPEASLGTVLEVLRRIKEDREVLIRVSAVDLPLLQACEAELAGALAGKKFSLLADARVEVGGCIVESQLGSLDGRLENQLRALCETIRAAKLAHQEAR